MQLKELVNFLDNHFPLSFQESYDNSGLLISCDKPELNSALVTLDINEEVVNEAISKDVDIIISHHPLIFKSLKRITGKTEVERCVQKLIQNNIGVYSAHTNLDSAQGGINDYLCGLLELNNCKVLAPIENILYKLVTYVPINYADKVRDTMFKYGAGNIGDYNNVSFNTNGNGTFKAGANANPFVGEKNKLHNEPEIRIETVVPKHILNNVKEQMIKAHPYEEVAYDIYKLDNSYDKAGLGRIGYLNESLNYDEFLDLVKHKLKVDNIRFTKWDKKIKKVALCSGTGVSFASNAISANADVYISADFKYHEFQSYENSIMIVDVGHYHSEKFVKDVFYNIFKENLPKFAVYLSDVNTNPINYY